MLVRRLASAMLVALTVLFTVLLSSNASAQNDETPKTEIFVGYQWLNPGGSVPAVSGTFNNPISLRLQSMPIGAGASYTYNFAPHLGIEGDFGANYSDQAHEQTVSVGPRLEFRGDGVSVFVHTLLSWNRLDPPQLSARNGIGSVLGGGMDINFNRRFSYRLFEADYVWGHQNFNGIVTSDAPGLERVSLEGVRLRTGLVFNFGYPATTSPSATLTVQPTDVMVGEPVTATASGNNFDPKHTLKYDWSSTCGKISGNGTSASIDTNGAPAGTCTVTVHISDPKRKKNGDATATATFNVKEPPKNPPTFSCTANPTSLQAGGTVNVSCACTSPDNVPVTVSGWTATGGNITGNGNNATLDTTNAPAGTITVNATCSDQRGLSTPASTQVTIEAPPPPPPAPPAQASKLSQCDFPNPVKPWRVDNTCKAILDDVAQRLQHDPDSKLVIVGNSEPGEKRRNLAAERAVNSKAYLSGGEAKQGIDPSRIETRTGSGGTKTAEYWIVPAGATFSGEGTTTVDESKVKAVPDHPHMAAKKKAAAQ
jgi:outer membrane protein OmpA-like peptidoglycan-associated protein